MLQLIFHGCQSINVPIIYLGRIHTFYFISNFHLLLDYDAFYPRQLQCGYFFLFLGFLRGFYQQLLAPTSQHKG